MLMGQDSLVRLGTLLTPLLLTRQALDSMKTAKSKRCYYDFKDMLATNPAGSVPYTPSLPLLYGLQESLNLLMAEGMDNVVKRHHRYIAGRLQCGNAWQLHGDEESCC